MRCALSMLIVTIMAAGCSFAVEYCPPQGCPPPAQPIANACAPAPQVCQRTRMVPVECEVDVPRGRWVNVRRTVPCTRTVYVNEPYTTTEVRYERRPERRTRRVSRTVTEYETRTVNETVYESVRDPATGRTCRVPRTVCRTERVPVKRRICVEEPYMVNVRHRVTVPVTKTRRVARTVPSTREVTERQWVTEMARERRTQMRPVVETYTVPPVCPPVL